MAYGKRVKVKECFLLKVNEITVAIILLFFHHLMVMAVVGLQMLLSALWKAR